MDGPNISTLADSNCNTSEQNSVTMSQDVKQLGNFDGRQNNSTAVGADLIEPKFIEITARVASNIEPSSLNSHLAPVESSCEPQSGNHSSEPANHCDQSLNEEDEIDRLEREVKETHRRMSLEMNQSRDKINGQYQANKNHIVGDNLVSEDKTGKSEFDSANLEAPCEPQEFELNPKKSTQKVTVSTLYEQIHPQQEHDVNSPSFSPVSQQDDNSSPSNSHRSPGEDDINKNDHEDKGQEEALGRNRRVRQKNRYFLDFHCSNLTKGSRSKDDFDAYAAATGGGGGGGSATRSSNRRSATDSSRTAIQGSQEEDDSAPLFVTKYCRSCYGRTPHDLETGCQACLYTKIVREQKRQKTTTQRSRPSRQQQHQQKPMEIADNDHETNQATDEVKSAPVSATSSSSNRSAKRKAETCTKNPSIPKITATMKVDGTGQKRKWVVKPSRSPNDENESSIRRETEHDSKTDSLDGKSSTLMANNENNTENNNNTNNIDDANKKVAKACDTKVGDNLSDNNDLDLFHLDKWTPEQVARYVTMKGFVSEADLFKSQAVDGFSLLLMQRTDFTYGLKMKLGPALKLHNQISKLKEEYFRQITSVS